MQADCQNCNGTGRNLFPYTEDGLKLAKVQDCKLCGGTGKVEVPELPPSEGPREP